MATSLQEVTELYRKYAKREPDASGLAYWMKDFGDSVSPEEETSFRESLYINEPNMDPNGVAYAGPAVYPPTQFPNYGVPILDENSPDLRTDPYPFFQPGTAMSSAQALDMMYKSSTGGGVATSEFDKYGGYNFVKGVAEAAGYSATPQFIQSYEIANNLPESAYTKLNKQFVGPDGAARQAQMEADLTSQNAALAAQTRANLAAQSAAADAAYKQQQQASIDKIIADRKVVAAATDAAYRRDYPALFAADPVQQNAARIAALNPTPAVPKTLNPSQTALAQITRPTAITQPSYTQLKPAAVTNTAITGTPYTNVYSPATMQQNAPTLAQISAASQSANPYQSLMSLTPQRTLSPAYAAQAGQTTANTNLGGYDSSLYSKPLTGLLAPSTVAGGGGADGINNSGDQRGPGTNNTASNIDPLALGMARVANIFSSPISLTTAPITTGTFNLTDAGRAAAADAATAAEFSGRTSGGDFGGDAYGGSYNFAKGGKVNMAPQMHNPPGPDDGYAALDNGEYVIRKSAVKKYGSNIFEQINAGKIPAQRLKSLLE